MERSVPVEVIGERYACPDRTCPAHGEPARIVVRRISIGRLPTGWSVRGSGHSSERTDRCPSCGALCQVILRRLPIELDGVPCPTCHRSSDFAYSLDCVETDGGEFGFTAKVECPGCSRKTFTGRIVEGLRRIKHLKLGPAGVEVELE